MASIASQDSSCQIRTTSIGSMTILTSRGESNKELFDTNRGDNIISECESEARTGTSRISSSCGAKLSSFTPFQSRTITESRLEDYRTTTATSFRSTTDNLCQSVGVYLIDIAVVFTHPKVVEKIRNKLIALEISAGNFTSDCPILTSTSKPIPTPQGGLCVRWNDGFSLVLEDVSRDKLYVNIRSYEPDGDLSPAMIPAAPPQAGASGEAANNGERDPKQPDIGTVVDHLIMPLNSVLKCQLTQYRMAFGSGNSLSAILRVNTRRSFLKPVPSTEIVPKRKNSTGQRLFACLIPSCVRPIEGD